ncbi:MAG: hypothetical protein ACK5XN_09635 [Bacteroidota bacterium]
MIEDDFIYSFSNETGEEIPPYACMILLPDATNKIAAVDTPDNDSDIVFKVRKCTSEDASQQIPSRVVFNLDEPVESGGFGKCTAAFPCRAIVDDGDLQIGGSVGPVANSWFMGPSGNAFIAVTVDVENAYYETSAKRTWFIKPNDGKPMGFANHSCSEIPAYACMEVSGTIKYGSETYLTVKKPSGDGPFVFNGPAAVPSCGYGFIQQMPIVRAKGAVAAKQKASPQSGSWDIVQSASGTWQSAGPDQVASGVTVLNASGLPSLTTTTSPILSGGPPPCQGYCYWTESGGTWVKATDTCAAATSTTSSTTTTTSACPCTSTTSSTTTTTVACQCARPTFCPFPGDCTYTYCDRQSYDAADPCSTSTTCNCNTTTTTSAPGTCGYYIECTSDPLNPGVVRSFYNCGSGYYCPAPSVGDKNELGWPCLTGTTYYCVATSTTSPCVSNNPPCRWIAVAYDSCGLRWERVAYCSPTVLDPDGRIPIDMTQPNRCGGYGNPGPVNADGDCFDTPYNPDAPWIYWCEGSCPHPNYSPSSCGEIAYTSCKSNVTDVCASCTSTTPSCNNSCRWRWSATMSDWNLASPSPCPGICQCSKPVHLGSGNCEISFTPCGSVPPPTTTSTSTTTTTTLPPWGACCAAPFGGSKTCSNKASASECSGDFYPGKTCAEINCGTTTTTTTSTTTTSTTSTTTTTTAGPTGACCLTCPSGGGERFCQPGYTSSGCALLAKNNGCSSVWLGAGTTCPNSSCESTGTCCKNGVASCTSQAYCTTIGGVWQGSPCFQSCTTTSTTTTTTSTPPTTAPPA